MKTGIKNLLAIVGFIVLAAGYAHASWAQTISSNGYYSGTASVPVSASCQQFGGAYNYGGGDGSSWTTVNGPLGNYSFSSPNSIYFNQSISSGSYPVLLITSGYYQGGSGYAGVVINW